jgi:beta-lactamase regulating signal transducer with metallopeptidase domain
MSILDEAFARIWVLSLRGASMVAVLWLASLLLPKALRSRVLSVAWVVIALRLLVPFDPPAAWPTGGPPSGLARTMSTGYLNRATAWFEAPGTASPPRPEGGDAKAGPQPDVARSRPFDGRGLAGGVWLSGAVLLAAIRIRALWRFRRDYVATARPPDERLARAVADISRELDLGPISVLATEGLASPGVFGVFHRHLLFPIDLAPKLSREELRLVIAHELGHLKRHDLAAQTLIQAARIVHWFNPLVWLAAHQAAVDGELACDSWVLRRFSAKEPVVYGEALMRVLRAADRAGHAGTYLGATTTRKQMRHRLLMIAHYKPTGWIGLAVGTFLVACVACVGFVKRAAAQEPAVASAPTEVTKSAPFGWWKNGDAVKYYVVGLDPTEPHGGRPSAYVVSTAKDFMGFGGMMQMCAADAYWGQRLRYTAWVKTKDAAQGAHLWFRVDGVGDKLLGFDNMEHRPVSGTTDWQEYSIVLDVPKDAVALAYGIFIKGEGKAWMSGPRFESVGKDVPTTNIERNLPKMPVNLGFEQNGP